MRSRTPPLTAVVLKPLVRFLVQPRVADLHERLANLRERVEPALELLDARCPTGVRLMLTIPLVGERQRPERRKNRGAGMLTAPAAMG